MSGLELLFVDGGTTVAGIVSAGAAALGVGYKQHRRDEEQLATPEELFLLRQMLRQAHSSVDAGHRALTATWQGPLSLFAAREEQAATARGVPPWAIAAVLKAQRLVDTAAELGDLTDVYEAQLIIAEKEDKGAQWAPVRALEERLDALGLQLTTHIPALIIAREAFDATAVGGGAAATAGAALLQGSERAGAVQPAPQGAVTGGPHEEQLEELPIAILRNRSRLGEVWASVSAVGQEYDRAMRRSLERRRNRDRPQDEPLEISPWALAYV